jgi:hypothetical protein
LVHDFATAALIAAFGAAGVCSTRGLLGAAFGAAFAAGFMAALPVVDLGVVMFVRFFIVGLLGAGCPGENSLVPAEAAGTSVNGVRDLHASGLVFRWDFH